MTVSELISPEVDDSVVAQVITLSPVISKGVLVTALVGDGDQEVAPPAIDGDED